MLQGPLTGEALQAYRQRKASIKHLYGLDIEDLLIMLDEQFEQCAICKVSVDYLSVHVDHDAKTGRVRGLLCAGCNVGLGHFKHRWSVLQRAAAYMLRDIKMDKSLD